MRQHRAFRLACRARGVKLDRDVLRADRHIRRIAALRVAPGRKILPFRSAAFGGDYRPYVGKSRHDAANQCDELGPDEQHWGLAVVDDEGDFRRGEAPVHRRHHHARLDRSQQQFEIDVAVLAEIGDALVGLDAERDQRIGDAVGVDVELGEACRSSLEFIGNRVSARFCAVPHHLGKVCRRL